ncbi:hypothetical protein [Streptomyces umbrinus]|nr:hypothetical protein [Streptomyces umbrinus]
MGQPKSGLLREEFRTVRTADFANVRLLLLERRPERGLTSPSRPGRPCA